MRMNTDLEHSEQQRKQSRWGFRGMTVRDWLQLLIVPLALVIIGFLFSAAAYSPACSGHHRVLVQCPAGRSPAEDREPTCRGRARACGAACAGRGAAILPRSDEWSSP